MNWRQGQNWSHQLRHGPTPRQGLPATAGQGVAVVVVVVVVVVAAVGPTAEGVVAVAPFLAPGVQEGEAEAHLRVPLALAVLAALALALAVGRRRAAEAAVGRRRAAEAADSRPLVVVEVRRRAAEGSRPLGVVADSRPAAGIPAADSRAVGTGRNRQPWRQDPWGRGTRSCRATG